MAEIKMNRRRHQRVAVALQAQVLGYSGRGAFLELRNLSPVGALLVGGPALKEQLYRRKNRYTHRPVNVRLVCLAPDLSPPLVIEGIGVYMRQLGDENIQVGFMFAQELSLLQLQGLLTSSAQDHIDKEQSASVA